MCRNKCIPLRMVKMGLFEANDSLIPLDEHLATSRDHNQWDVIVNGDLEEEPTPTTRETSAPPAPKTAKQLAARRNQERVKSILLLAIPDEYLLKFHNVADAKSLWEAIKSSLDKAYNRFQKLISQLEVHGAPISKEDINQKFLRSLPPSWNQISLIMRNKPDIDEIDIDDLYNNLRVYEDEMKSTASGDFGVSTSRGTSQVSSTPCAHYVAYSFLAQPTTNPQLENEDFQQIDEDDLEELDLRWQMAMLTVKVKKKGHFARDYRSGRNQGRRSYGDNGMSNTPTNESSSQALVAQDEKVVKERDDLKLKIENWEESSRHLDEILNSQMSARDKTGLGYGTQLNELSSNHETDSENSLSIFDVRSSDEENTPANDRFSKADGYHVVPSLITGNFLTLRADISFAGLDKYAIRKKITESKTTKLNTKTSKTAGITNDANTEKSKSASESVVSKPKIIRDRVIIEDWNSDDEDNVSEVQTVNLVKTNETQIVKTRVDKTGVLTRTGSARPNVSTARSVCTARPSVSPARPVCTARPSVRTARPVCTARPSVSTARPVSFARPSVSTARPIYATRPIYPRLDNVRPRGSYSPIKRSYYTKPAFRPKDLKQDVKTFRVQNMTTAGTRAVVNTSKGKMDTGLKKSRWVWRPKGNYLDHVSKDSGSFMLKKVEYVDQKGISKSDHAIVDSGCSCHMTRNKAYLSDYEDYNGDFMAFGSDPKGDELKFNLFSVSQMCDKKNSVLFTETECLILSPSFKLPDESQVVLRAPRKDDVYSLDLKKINVVAERKNRTLIEAARSKQPSIIFIRPFGCPLTILNTLDSLGKFDGKSDEGTGPDWMFDLDFLTNTMNYIPVSIENQVNVDAGTQDSYVAGSSGKDKEPTQKYILLPLHPYRTRILVEDGVHDAQEKPPANASLDKDV
ncbi:hypothetical protein Tco_0985040 [Tanacetum coccineum]